VTTIEGISEAGRPSALQRAFLEEQAGQCGYCLTGVIVTATALLERKPNPTRQEIGEALVDVLCRCGAQDRMIRAIQRASRSFA
jgi:nicotinate dehydrogenase subunit A